MRNLSASSRRRDRHAACSGIGHRHTPRRSPRRHRPMRTLIALALSTALLATGCAFDTNGDGAPQTVGDPANVAMIDVESPTLAPVEPAVGIPHAGETPSDVAIATPPVGPA